MRGIYIIVMHKNERPTWLIVDSSERRKVENVWTNLIEFLYLFFYFLKIRHRGRS